MRDVKTVVEWMIQHGAPARWREEGRIVGVAEIGPGLGRTWTDRYVIFTYGLKEVECNLSILLRHPDLTLMDLQRAFHIPIQFEFYKDPVLKTVEPIASPVGEYDTDRTGYYKQALGDKFPDGFLWVDDTGTYRKVFVGWSWVIRQYRWQKVA